MKKRKRLFTFDTLPSVKHRRSYFPESFGHTTSLTAGRLQPVYIQEVYPGDTWKMKANCVAQVSSAFLKPVMDNAFIELTFFFVPHRLAFDKFAEIFGENNDSAWARQTPVEMPVVPPGSGSKVKSGTLADFLGLPLTSFTATYDLGGDVPVSETVDNYCTFEPQIIPFRDVAIIWNDWWRNENVNQPMHIQRGAFASSERLDNAEWSPNHYTGLCPPVNKSKDYFTTALPSPQKGDAVQLGIGGSISAKLPVIPTNDNYTNLILSDGVNIQYTQFDRGSSGNILNGLSSGDSGEFLFGYRRWNPNAGEIGVGSDFSKPDDVLRTSYTSLPVNLSAFANDIPISPVDVNDFRYAIALQSVLERAGRMGTRYVEYLLSAFGVVSSDARLQRSEYLGGAKFPISIQQVAQTSQTSESSPLGSLGAYSLSNGMARYNRGFVEHGYIIGFACLKQFHTYQQGVERFWKRKSQFDFYDPYLSNISEQPIWQDELFTQGTTNDVAPSGERKVFGYGEAWNDLRFRRNQVTGNLRFNSTKYKSNGDPALNNSLGIWKFADVYQNAPSLNSDFLEEVPYYIDNTLSVESDSQDQFLLDIWFEQSAYRVMPVYSTPARLK